MSVVRIKKTPLPEIHPNRMAALVTRALLSPTRDDVSYEEQGKTGGNWIRWCEGNTPTAKATID